MARLCWGAFGHGMPCPYWGEVRKNEIGADVPGISDLRCVDALAQAGLPVLLNSNR